MNDSIPIIKAKYCEECTMFSPEFNQNVIYGDDAQMIIQQYATCKDAEHCAILMAYLKSQKG